MGKATSILGEYTLAAENGGHAALYLMGRWCTRNLELLSMTPTARIVRLTRLR